MKIENISPYSVILICKSYQGEFPPRGIKENPKNLPLFVEVTAEEYETLDKAVYALVKEEKQVKGVK
jgi:hypothetical protein